MKSHETEPMQGARTQPAAQFTGATAATGPRQRRQALQIAALRSSTGNAGAEVALATLPQAGVVMQLSATLAAMPGLHDSGNSSYEEDEEEEEKKSAPSSEGTVSEEEDEPANTTAGLPAKVSEGVKKRAVGRYLARSRHAGTKDNSGHGKGKRISKGNSSDKHQVGQNRKVNRKKTLAKRVAVAEEELAEVGMTPADAKGQRAKERREKEAARKQKKKEQRKQAKKK